MRLRKLLSNIWSRRIEKGVDDDDIQSIANGVERPLASLCSHCQNMLSYIASDWDKLREYTREYKYSSHCADGQALAASAHAGCGLCMQFMLGEVNVHTYKSTDYPYKDNKNNCDGEISLSTGFAQACAIFRGYKNRDIPIFEIRLILPYQKRRDENCDEGDVQPLCEERKVVMAFALRQAILYDSQDTRSINTQDALPLARAWLTKCLKSHIRCSPEEQMLPTRLVLTQEDRIRLCTAAEIKGYPRYATLSHCWGTVPFETLTKANYTAFRERITLDTLPKTFRDAIRVARYLGFQYIWIDSLCIIQDDLDDWATESLLMSSVYGSATLNLAASDASNGSVGCFSDRSNLWRCQVRLDTSRGSVLYECVPEISRYTLNSLTSLSKRGWVIQERMLAHRTLHFTSTQLFWECEEETLCERFPQELPDYFHNDVYLARRPLTSSCWYSLMEAYTRARLTYNKDKLVAIAGIARLVQSNTKDQYIAGMWRKNLETQLCWSADGPDRKRIVPYVAPSWSWASIDSNRIGLGSMNFSSSEVDLYVRVQDTKIIYTTANADADQFGEILSATLRLSCRCLIHTRLEDRDGKASLILVNDRFLRVHANFDCVNKSKRTPFYIHVLPVYYTDGTRSMSGLIVEPTNHSPGQYRRVGELDFFNHNMPETFEAAARNTHLEDSEYIEKSVDADGLTRYIIDII